jgi:23S rRNA pseudouridine2605 synthase
MRINRYIANATGLSRRAADEAITQNRVLVNGKRPEQGQDVSEQDSVVLDDRPIHAGDLPSQTILLNKPTGVVVSRDGQGSKTVYDILPASLHHLKSIGRLDKYSSGLLLLTTDGQLAEQLTHPKYEKLKTYEIAIDKPLQPLHHQMICDAGITLADGVSKLSLERMRDGDDYRWLVRMHEGRNRQIRRTFESLGYHVTQLHRTHFGAHTLPATLKPGEYRSI